eukprot:527063-Pleurochrysis_carterae.AAC.2
MLLKWNLATSEGLAVASDMFENSEVREQLHVASSDASSSDSSLVAGHVLPKAGIGGIPSGTGGSGTPRSDGATGTPVRMSVLWSPASKDLEEERESVTAVDSRLVLALLAVAVLFCILPPLCALPRVSESGMEGLRSALLRLPPVRASESALVSELALLRPCWLCIGEPLGDCGGS